jgi:hypothetical protein
MTAERRVMTAAALGSLLVHAVVLIATWDLSLSAVVARPAGAKTEREVELLLVPDPDRPQDADRPPERYTAIPERLATETPPDDPDYLALHNSRAADRIAGGEDAQPGAELESEVEQVAIEKQELDDAGAVAYAPQEAPVGGGQPAEGREGVADRDRREGEQISPNGDWALAQPEDEASAGSDDARSTDDESAATQDVPDWLSGGEPSILKPGSAGSAGDRGFDLDRMATGKVRSSVSIDGAYSLNTYEWDFAPWMHRFEQDLHRVWRAPYAYLLGVISGKTVIRLVIERDGTPSAMDVLETEGHESLHKASLSALRAFAPYAPLPPDFPEDNLVIVLSLHYPAWNR